MFIAEADSLSAESDLSVVALPELIDVPVLRAQGKRRGGGKKLKLLHGCGRRCQSQERPVVKTKLGAGQGATSLCLVFAGNAQLPELVAFPS